jgi:cytochrome c biogenesis protein CcmG/thiol:disulfide interchange protein DsbE
MNRALRFLPLLILIAIVGALAWRLSSPPDEKIASKMIGKSLADVRAAPALPGRPGIFVGDPYGNPRVINFFASWCVPCIAEMPLLLKLRREGVGVDGIAVRDKPEDIAAFLKAHGDPYGEIGADPHSNVQLQFGSSGVPETFIIDPYGVVRYQHIGPLEPKDIAIIRDKWSRLRK